MLDRVRKEEQLKADRAVFMEKDRQTDAVANDLYAKASSTQLKDAIGITPKSVEEFDKLIKEQGITMDAVRKRVREALRVQKVIRRKVALRVSVTDTEIVQYVEENRPKLETGLSYHARHLLVVPESPDDKGWEAARIKAEILRSQIVDGADFATIARQSSQDASGKDGGDLGTLKRGELAPEIEAAILKLEPGEFSAPVRSGVGYHLFQKGGFVIASAPAPDSCSHLCRFSHRDQ